MGAEIPFKSEHAWQILEEEITDVVAGLFLSKISIVQLKEQEDGVLQNGGKQLITVLDQATLIPHPNPRLLPGSRSSGETTEQRLVSTMEPNLGLFFTYDL